MINLSQIFKYYRRLLVIQITRVASYLCRASAENLGKPNFGPLYLCALSLYTKAKDSNQLA
jgi:hypothetical protein